jgi:hypothetical protein
MGDSLQERVQTLADTIYSADAMRRAIDRQEFLETCLPCDLEIPKWRVLRQIEVPMPVRGGRAMDFSRWAKQEKSTTVP